MIHIDAVQKCKYCAAGDTPDMGWYSSEFASYWHNVQWGT